MKVDRRVAIVATFAMAAALTQCKKSPTAPASTRTYSVTATPLSVPAVPTAPATIATNDPQSKVSVTLSVATLQQIVQAAGGAATVTMTDLAPVDYGTLPGGEGALIRTNAASVLKFTIAKSSAAAGLALSPASATAGPISAQSTSAGSVSFSIILTSGATCGAQPALFVFTSAATSFGLVDNTSFTYNAGPPTTITGTTTRLSLNSLTSLLEFYCAGVTISGGSGGNGGG